METQLSSELNERIAVKIENLTVRTRSAGQPPILDRVSCEFYEHAINTVVGPSGSGKSTLLRAINRLNEINGLVTEGKIIVDGKDVSHMNAIELRRKVGMVFQQPNPFPGSIFDNVAFGPRLHWKMTKRELNEVVKDALERVGLYEEVKDKLMSSAMTLSGGQKQRLCIARAIAVRPSVLLMDEPTSSLDPKSKSVIEELMIKLKGEATIVLVTHDISQAKRVSDHVILLRNGRVESSEEAENALKYE
ncbi:MAG TPA: ATP-binding cassette domain-containing protein [Thermoprotei archaeon]|nr:ATP-binding cassette domain-containing protein [TACK group archaeon]HEV51149.1 ATP-binding cassette domain-containing protein [Thermoprotei archaeon]